MIKHKKQVEMPVEQIKYDPVKVKERLDKIKKKRAVINNSLTAVSFTFLVAAIILLVLFFFRGDSVHIDNDRILENLQSLYYRNNEIIVAHSKVNLLSMQKIAGTTFFTLIIPNFLCLGTGIKEFMSRLGANIYPEQNIKQLWDCVVANNLAILKGFQKLVSTIQKKFSSVLH